MVLSGDRAYYLTPGFAFENRHVRLTPDGVLTIHQGYGWDGCTLAPDTPACLLHDALYQFLVPYPFSRAQADRFFYDQMRADGFPLAGLYFVAVRCFGWCFR